MSLFTTDEFLFDLSVFRAFSIFHGDLDSWWFFKKNCIGSFLDYFDVSTVFFGT